MSESYLLVPGNISVETALEAGPINVFLPGRGRSEDGLQLTEHSIARAHAVANFFHEHNLLGTEATVVSSGYKTPAERATQRVTIPELRTTTIGIPEAVMYNRLLASLGIPEEQRRTEPRSFDSVTNLAYSLDSLPEGPVAIAAQEGHLGRFLKYIAPGILDPDTRPFIGLKVLEADPDNPDPDSKFAEIFSRIVMTGIHPQSRNLQQRVTKRARRMWGLAKPLLLASGNTYNTGDSVKKAA